ncbi:LysE family translocator [Thalassobaculum fulvum]|nr:LysE family translocator [Thalassobaculum fulvum]
MSFETWIAFTVLETLLCLVPGPAVLFVMGQGLVQGPRPAIAAGLGILSANTLYFAVSATGLGALLLASYEVFFAIKWLGVAYLLWIGLQALLARPEALAVARARPAGAWRVLRRGFLVQAANPKSILFFGALLPQFVDPAGNVAAQLLLLGLTSVAVEFVVLAAYGGLAGRLRRFATRPAVVMWFDRAAGGLLIAAGLGMAAIRRGD